MPEDPDHSGPSKQDGQEDDPEPERSGFRFVSKTARYVARKGYKPEPDFPTIDRTTIRSPSRGGRKYALF